MALLLECFTCRNFKNEVDTYQEYVPSHQNRYFYRPPQRLDTIDEDIDEDTYDEQSLVNHKKQTTSCLQKCHR